MFLIYKNSAFYKYTLIIHILRISLVCILFLYSPRFITDNEDDSNVVGTVSNNDPGGP